MTIDELKPCPFCGGEARLKKHYRLEQIWYVQCHDCGIRTPNSTQAAYEPWKEARDYPVKSGIGEYKEGIMNTFTKWMKKALAIKEILKDCDLEERLAILSSLIDDQSYEFKSQGLKFGVE